MSFILDVGETTVWSPALKVGDLYVRFLGQIGDSVGLPTGLSAMASDYCYMDPDVFEVLITKVFEDNFRSTHDIGRAMLESVLAPSAVILKRIGRPLVARTSEERNFLERAYALSMAQ